jgi:hypothetical protein
MLAASRALCDLLEGVDTPEEATSLGILADALRMACARLSEIEAATRHTGWRH